MTTLAQVDLTGGLEEAWQRIITFLPKLLAFLLILVIGYFVAKAIQKILDRVLERVGFDRVVERGGIKRALEGSQYDASGILSKIVFYIVFLFVLQLAFGVFGPNPISDLIASIVAFLPRLFVAIVIVVIAGAVAAAVRTIIETALGGLPYGRIVAMAATGLIWFIGIAAALNQIEVAPAIVTGLYYAVLAIIVGIVVVSVGGGGIQPMRERWERALGRVEREAPRIREEARGSTEELRQRADETRQRVEAEGHAADRGENPESP